MHLLGDLPHFNVSFPVIFQCGIGTDIAFDDFCKPSGMSELHLTSVHLCVEESLLNLFLLGLRGVRPSG